jgi:hypothetical protein
MFRVETSAAPTIRFLAILSKIALGTRLALGVTVLRSGTAAVAGQLSLMLLATHGASGCSPESASPHYFDPAADVYVSHEFTPEQAQVVLGALTSWSEATRGGVRFNAHLGSGTPQIRPALQDDGVVGEFIPSERPEIVLDTQKAAGPRELRNLTLHEVGHALGLQHIERVDSVMFPVATVVQELDPWTLAAWQRLRAPERSAGSGHTL